MQKKTNLPASPAVPPVGLACRKFSKAKSIALRLGLCRRTIFRWADAGKIARYKINGRVVLFDEAEVIALIESARTISPPATGYSQYSLR